jgi:large exoprotein involved in heme utilization and adhesion
MKKECSFVSVVSKSRGAASSTVIPDRGRLLKQSPVVIPGRGGLSKISPKRVYQSGNISSPGRGPTAGNYLNCGGNSISVYFAI